MAIINSSVEQTTLFKSCVKTILTRNKAIGGPLPTTKVFPSPPTTFSKLFTRAKDIQTNLQTHRSLLLGHSRQYLNEKEQSMTDNDRDYLEKVITSNLKIIEDNIRTLETELIKITDGANDAATFRKHMLDIIRFNFAQTNTQFKGIKEERLRKRREKSQLTKLQRPASSKKKISSIENVVAGELDNKKSANISRVSEPPRSKESKPHIESNGLEINNEPTREILSGLSGEELQMLEAENTHLYRDLMSDHEEVRQITKQVIELAQMQDLLSENVEIQSNQIDDIQDTVVAATENVHEGNEQVREAMRKDAGFRIWIMFFLIVMSFTVLFLDWYNS